MTASDRRLKRRIYNSLAGAASLAIIALYVARLGLGSNDLQPTLPGSTADIADKIAIDISIVRYDTAGAMDSRLTATSAEYFDARPQLDGETELWSAQRDADNEFDMPVNSAGQITAGHATSNSSSPQSKNALIKLNTPLLTLHQANNTQIHTQAHTGYLLPTQHTIRLTGDVRLTDEASQSSLASQSLTIDTQQKQLFTRDTVELTNPNSVTTAAGLQGNLAQKHWQLLGNVQSTIYNN